MSALDDALAWHRRGLNTAPNAQSVKHVEAIIRAWMDAQKLANSITAADFLAGACCRAVDEHFVDARSEIGDALLDYASSRHGDSRPIDEVRSIYKVLHARRHR